MGRGEEARKSRARPLAWIYLEVGSNVFPNRSTSPLALGLRRRQVVGLGLGGMWLRKHPALAPGTNQELLLQPLLPRNQTSFTQPPLLLILSGLGTFISTRRARFPTRRRRNNQPRRRRLPRDNSGNPLNSFILFGFASVVSRQLSGFFLWPPRLTRRRLGRENQRASTARVHVDRLTVSEVAFYLTSLRVAFFVFVRTHQLC